MFLWKYQIFTNKETFYYIRRNWFSWAEIFAEFIFASSQNSQISRFWGKIEKINFARIRSAKIISWGKFITFHSRKKYMDFSILGCNPNIIALKDAVTLNHVLLIYQTKYRHRVFLYLVALNFFGNVLSDFSITCECGWVG